MLNVVIAADSFKGSATSIEVADYLEVGMLKANAQLTVVKVPIADGGEGTVKCVIAARNGTMLKETVSGPVGDPQEAFWGLIDKSTAIIETAEIVGLPILGKRLDIAHASTYGIGELILRILDYGVKTIYIGLGGSATNDAGVGMAQALGIQFKDSDGREIERGVSSISRLNEIEYSKLDPRLKQTKVIGLSDVDNPLTGLKGATAIFGPQKGATPEQVKVYDDSLVHLSKLVSQHKGTDDSVYPGAGAAGGLGYGIMSFLNGEIKSGISEVMKIVHLKERIKEADLVITGEGRIDNQSLGGKVPVGVASLAKKLNKSVVAVVGGVGDGAERVYETGIDLVIPTTNRPMTVDEAVDKVGDLISGTGFTLVKALQLGAKLNVECPTKFTQDSGLV
ncbi:glycerate kinase [Lentilactobacillus hilgardii]|uniref:glycerate kinase family protein n=1 Tax=Lentilactobacillus hilgardii TaxID=1588 RepID=UPI0039EBBAB5